MQEIGVAENENTVAPTIGRRLVMNMVGLSLLAPLVACGKSGILMKKEINITVVMYSFLDRPIFDIVLNGRDIGVASSYGTTSMVTGVTVPMGAQKLTWRLGGPKGKPRNGETDSMKNTVVINPRDVPRDADYLGVYLYPDDTVEFTFSKYMPGHSARGEAIMKALEVK